jgi:hypothetical protein
MKILKILFYNINYMSNIKYGKIDGNYFVNDKEIDFYKSDIKYGIKHDISKYNFVSEHVEKLYNKFKNKASIEFRIEDAKLENYEYFDLSKLTLTDKLLNHLINIDIIDNILKKIYFLDLSNNNLSSITQINKILDIYKNIKILDISNNKFKGEFINNTLDEFICQDNDITCIKSNTMKKINAMNNQIHTIEIPLVETLYIKNNNLTSIGNCNNLSYLNCCDNNIIDITHLRNLEELYITNNKINSLKSLNNLFICNCVNNPIEKIDYLDKIIEITCSTDNISSKYIVSSSVKNKNNYLFNFSR